MCGATRQFPTLSLCDLPQNLRSCFEYFWTPKFRRSNSSVMRIRMWAKIKSDRRIQPKNSADRWICIPLFTPPPPPFPPLNNATPWTSALAGPVPVETHFNSMPLITVKPFHAFTSFTDFKFKLKLDLGSVTNLTGFSTQLSDRIQSNLYVTVTLGKWPGDCYMQGDRYIQVS